MDFMSCELKDTNCTQRVASINQLNKFLGLFYIYIKYININTQAAAVEGVEFYTKMINLNHVKEQN